MTLEQALDKFTVMFNPQQNEISFRYSEHRMTDPAEGWVTLYIDLSLKECWVCRDWERGVDEYHGNSDMQRAMQYYESRYDLTGLKRRE